MTTIIGIMILNNSAIIKKLSKEICCFRFIPLHCYRTYKVNLCSCKMSNKQIRNAYINKDNIYVSCVLNEEHTEIGKLSVVHGSVTEQESLINAILSDFCIKTISKASLNLPSLYTLDVPMPAITIDSVNTQVKDNAYTILGRHIYVHITNISEVLRKNPQLMTIGESNVQNIYVHKLKPMWPQVLYDMYSLDVNKRYNAVTMVFTLGDNDEVISYSLMQTQIYIIKAYTFNDNIEGITGNVYNFVNKCSKLYNTHATRFIKNGIYTSYNNPSDFIHSDKALMLYVKYKYNNTSKYTSIPTDYAICTCPLRKYVSCINQLELTGNTNKISDELIMHVNSISFKEKVYRSLYTIQRGLQTNEVTYAYKILDNMIFIPKINYSYYTYNNALISELNKYNTYDKIYIQIYSIQQYIYIEIK